MKGVVCQFTVVSLAMLGGGRAEPLPTAMSTSNEALLDGLQARPVDDWYGLYIGGRKVGYSRIEARVVRRHPDPRVVIRVDVQTADGQLALNDERVFGPGPRLPLVERCERQVSGAETGLTCAAVVGEKMVVLKTSNWRLISAHVIDKPREVYACGVVLPGISNAKVKVGETTVCHTLEFDPLRETTDRWTVEQVATRRIAGIPQVVIETTEREEGAPAARQMFGEHGTLISGTMGGIELRAEDRAAAQRALVSLESLTWVPVARRLGDKRVGDSSRLLVRVPANFALEDLPNQRVERQPDGRFMVTLTSGRSERASPEARRRALAPTESIDSASPAIVAQAQRIVADAPDRRAKVERLVRWVDRNLTGTLTTQLFTASEVLGQRRGDCTEHTLLFVALARAAGVPARPVSGLRYGGDDSKSFGYHAWAEVELDGHWVPVDPTWGEPVVPPITLRLGAGTADHSHFAVGATEIEVVE